MFKIAVNDANHANIITDAFQIRDQGAHSADQQINRYARTGRRIESINEALIDQVVQF
ncbi:hypothetical protein D3C73_1313690 [compost metagenome]